MSTGNVGLYPLIGYLFSQLKAGLSESDAVDKAKANRTYGGFQDRAYTLAIGQAYANYSAWKRMRAANLRLTFAQAYPYALEQGEIVGVKAHIKTDCPMCPDHGEWVTVVMNVGQGKTGEDALAEAIRLVETGEYRPRTGGSYQCQVVEASIEDTSYGGYPGYPQSL